jgi:hypothetical protein
MGMEFALYGEYIATVMIPVGGKQLAMGIHQKDGSFATWEIVDGKHQNMHLFHGIDETTEDLCIRTLGELWLKRQPQKKMQERGR